jgi:hypothetical protein
MRRGSTIRWPLAVGIVIMLSLCDSLSHAGTMKERRSATGPVASGMATPSAIVTGRETELRQMPTPSVAVESAVVLRTIPTVSALVSVGSMTLVPYIGAGFGGGYTTELDRSLHTAPAASALSNSTNIGLRNLFGQQLIPNEVQLGIRFPF